MNKTKIVIIGGGFGGVYTARYLERLFNENEAEITLINKSNFFQFNPLLHEVATGGLTPESIVEPIREVFRGENIIFIEDTAIEVKRDTKEVLTTNRTFSYDYLVISTGADTNYYGTPGAKENTFTLKSLQDAVALRNHIIETFEQAGETKNRDLLSFAVIGAGATGVELVAEIEEYAKETLCAYYRNSGFTKDDAKIHLITATPDIISMFPEDMRALALAELQKKGVEVMLSKNVVKVDPHLISFKDNTTLSAHTIIWVAGVMPSAPEIKGIEVGPKGRIEINDYLQSIKNSEVIAVGDSAGTSPMLAQVAVQQARTAANNIYNLAKNAGKSDKLVKFKFFQKGLLVSLGQWYALGHFFGLTFRGRMMWLLWRAIYLFNFLSWRKKIEIAVEWIINFFYPRDISYLK